MELKRSYGFLVLAALLAAVPLSGQKAAPEDARGGPSAAFSAGTLIPVGPRAGYYLLGGDAEAMLLPSLAGPQTVKLRGALGAGFIPVNSNATLVNLHATLGAEWIVLRRPAMFMTLHAAGGGYLGFLAYDEYVQAGADYLVEAGIGWHLASRSRLQWGLGAAYREYFGLCSALMLCLTTRFAPGPNLPPAPDAAAATAGR